MAVVKFKYVVRDRDRHGNVRFYVKIRGKPKVRLKGLPGSEEFVSAYRAAIGELKQNKSEQTFRWLCERYFASGNFLGLDPVTQRRKQQALEELCEIVAPNGRKIGTFPFAGMQRKNVCWLRDLKATLPEAANYRVKQLSSLFGWALKNDLMTTNPAEKVERLKGRSDGYYTWTEDDVLKFETHWPVGTKARLAMAIMLYLGVRRSDAVAIGKQHESSDGLSVSFRLACPCSRCQELS